MSNLDNLKRSIAVEVARRFSGSQIRARIFANLRRWRKSGAWVSAYDEWKAIAETGDDEALFTAMLGTEEDSVRLRKSMPYVGLLPRDVVRKLNADAST